jgi:hypothetical protein
MEKARFDDLATTCPASRAMNVEIASEPLARPEERRDKKGSMEGHG